MRVRDVGIEGFAKVDDPWHRTSFRLVKDDTGGYRRPTGCNCSEFGMAQPTGPMSNRKPVHHLWDAAQVRVVTEKFCDGAFLS